MLSITFGRFPSEIERELSSSDYTDLMAYYRVEPWGPQRDNLHSAQIAALTYNANRGNGRPVKIDDFMFKPEVKIQRDADSSARAFLKSKVKSNG